MKTKKFFSCGSSLLGFGSSVIAFEEKLVKAKVIIVTTYKMKFSVQNLYSKSGKTRRKLLFCSHFHKKYLNESSFFCAVC